MQPLFYKLSKEQRSQILDTVYTGMLAINLLFLQSLLGSSPEPYITIALANFAVGIPASGGAIISRRIHQHSTPTDAILGTIAFLNTTVGVSSALWRFSPQISLTFVGLTLAAIIMVILGHNRYPIHPLQENQQMNPVPPFETNPHQEPKRKKRR